MSDVMHALAETEEAGWMRPLRVEPCTFGPSWSTSWDLVEADGTRIAIVGVKQDADLILAALIVVLEAADEARELSLRPDDDVERDPEAADHEAHDQQHRAEPPVDDTEGNTP